MQRSGSQKFLLVISVINIVFAVIGILASIAGIAGGAFLGGSSEAAAELSGTGVTAGAAGGAMVILFLFALITCVIELVVGILGVRAANDNSKIMPVWVLAIIQLALCVVSLISTVVNGGEFISSILSVAFAGLMFWAANNIKKEAGR